MSSIITESRSSAHHHRRPRRLCSAQPPTSPNRNRKRHAHRHSHRHRHPHAGKDIVPFLQPLVERLTQLLQNSTRDTQVKPSESARPLSSPQPPTLDPAPPLHSIQPTRTAPCIVTAPFAVFTPSPSPDAERTMSPPGRCGTLSVPAAAPRRATTSRPPSHPDGGFSAHARCGSRTEESPPPPHTRKRVRTRRHGRR